MSRILCFVALIATVMVASIAPTPPPAAAERAVGHLPTPEDFVAQQYEDFLGRAPDEAGLRYWSNLVRDGAVPAGLVEAMATSAEFEGTIAPLVRLYFAFFDRAPDYEGLIFWAGVVRSGMPLDQVAHEFSLSVEFTATYGTLSNGQYVDLVYRNVLGRDADQTGRAYWVDQLDGGLDRGRLMAAFSESGEYRLLADPRVKATMLYIGMLRRSPDGAGLAYWAHVIGAGIPYQEVIGSFLDGAEYGYRMARIYAAAQPLSGVATRASEGRPALAVKIDNVDRARPQTGLDRADLVYEEMVEGNLTRLVAVFHSDVPVVVGPVRSVRSTDIDVLDQLRTPLLAASGANPGVLALVAEAEARNAIVNVNAIVAGGAYFRSSAKRAPHNLFARTADLYRLAGDRGRTPTALFTYRRPGTTLPGGSASTGVDLAFGRADISFRWSVAEGGWTRTQNGTAHVLSGGARLAPANVVVLEMPYGVSSIDAQSPEAHSVGSGRAWVFSTGRVVACTWSRANSTDPIALLDGDGDPIGLTTGQTFVELAPPGSITVR